MEIQRHAIQAIAKARGLGTIIENVTEMAAAAGAENLRAVAVGVDLAADCPVYLVVEGRPAAMRVELVVGAVERRVAAAGQGIHGLVWAHPRRASRGDGVGLRLASTMTTFGIMLVLYLTGIIKVNKKFQSVLMVAAVSYIVLAQSQR